MDMFSSGAKAVGSLFGGGDVNYEGQNTGYPDMPGYESVLGEQEKNLNGIPSLNRAPLDQLESYAHSGTDNPWVHAQMEALKQSQGQAMGDAKANAAAGTTASMDNMAAHGGLNTGAMENLNRNGANNATMAGQKVIGQGLEQEGKINTQNAQNQIGVMENLPGQEVQATQPGLQKASLWQSALGQDSMNKNAFNMTGYQNQIAKNAGTEEAQAQANKGKK